MRLVITPLIKAYEAVVLYSEYILEGLQRANRIHQLGC